MTDPRPELETVLDRLRREHDVAPCMAALHPTRDMAFWALPPDMLKVLAGSPDWNSLAPGAGPLWLQISADDAAAELVLYRAEADGELYVLAPEVAPS